MSIEGNKAIARRYFEELDRRKALPEDLVAPTYKGYFAGSPPMDFAGLKQNANMFYSAFPDLTHIIDDAIAEGDKVSVRLTMQGTHKGNLKDILPTGKQVSFSGINLLRIVDGKLVEQWAVVDQMGLMQQLGTA